MVAWFDKRDPSTAIEPKQLALLYDEDMNEGGMRDRKGEKMKRKGMQEDPSSLCTDQEGKSARTTSKAELANHFTLA